MREKWYRTLVIVALAGTGLPACGDDSTSSSGMTATGTSAGGGTAAGGATGLSLIHI